MKSNLGLVLFSLLVLFSPLYTTAEETGLAEKTFSKADLLVHIEKAERGVRAEDWESILREDLSAVPSWESAELLAEFEGRFGVWLGKRASESLPKADLGGFLEELADADRAYLVETDSSGKVKYDEAGDPVFKGLAGYQADESAWKSRLETKMNEALALWERDAKVECQELLAPLSGDLAAIGTVRLTASLAEYKAATHREFDRPLPERGDAVRRGPSQGLLFAQEEGRRQERPGYRDEPGRRRGGRPRGGETNPRDRAHRGDGSRDLGHPRESRNLAGGLQAGVQ